MISNRFANDRDRFREIRGDIHQIACLVCRKFEIDFIVTLNYLSISKMDKPHSLLDEDDSSSDDSSIEETLGGMNLPVKKKPEKEKARWTDDEVC